ncbi:hypothetical protein [Sphingomonas sp. GB1N7]|uniref:hypothetical protein n=1 Tax=Parasphingomonas caseinilytica TaxID=3096158 RepID=UPI002FCC9F81
MTLTPIAGTKIVTFTSIAAYRQFQQWWDEAMMPRSPYDLEVRSENELVVVMGFLCPEDRFLAALRWS